MERKNDSTILLLVAAGLGIYWFMKNKSVPPATTPTTTAVSDNPANVEVKSTQPVYNAPITQTPTPEMPTGKSYTDLIDSIFNTGAVLQTSGAQKDKPYQ